MTHADTMVRAIYADLSARYALPDCLTIEDEPAGDFGIAHYYGLSNGCGRMSFDVGYLPSRHTVVHEFGHAVHATSESLGIFAAFWAEAGFPLTTGQAMDTANAYTGYQQWRRIPSEMIAEMFAWVFLGDYCNTETFGVSLTDDLRSRLDQMFSAYKEDSVALSDIDKQEIQAMISAASISVIREISDKLDSGFNTSVTTFLDRQTAGDKRVATAEVDQ